MNNLPTGWINFQIDFLKRLLASRMERSPGPHDVSQAEALAILDEAEKVRLVHTVSNVVKGIDYICNCCGCCCEILRGINVWGIENSIVKANYYAMIDLDECTGCGICIERSKYAISEEGGVAVVKVSKS